MLRVIVKVGQAHAKQKPWSLVRDFTGGSEAGNSKSCWKSGFKGSCVADCPEFDTSRGAPGPWGNHFSLGSSKPFPGA